MADCQVRTWWEKDVREEPWADVEKTGWRRTPVRKRFRMMEAEGRKKERWEMRVGLRMVDSKLPGSMTGGGGGDVSSGCSCVSPSREAPVFRL